MTYRFPIVVGDRVAVAPHTDEFMAGLRFGVVMKVKTDPRLFGAARYTIVFSGGTMCDFYADDLLGATNAVPGKTGA